MNRQGLQAVLAAARAHEVEALVILKLDRLTRSVVDLNNLVVPLNKYKVDLVSIEEHLDATTPTGQLMMNLLASVSQWERQIIGARTKEAMLHLRAQRRVYCRPVFGYDCKKGRLLENKKEQVVIEQVRKWRSSGKTYRDIAAERCRNPYKTRGPMVEFNSAEYFTYQQVRNYVC
jgi:DNA invertase Pin-like site-specific DNA recombinase